MIVGHSFLAFVIAAFVLWRFTDVEPEKIIAMSAFAGLFALVPDIDIIYAWKEIVLLFSSGFTNFADSFWATSSLTHRGVTHTLLAGTVGATAFSMYFWRQKRHVALLSAGMLFMTGLLIGTGLEAVLMLAYAGLGLLLTRLASEHMDLGEFAAVSAFGLLSHPFGDIFTGVPPQMFFPFTPGILETRIFFFQAPVLNLLAVFSIELSLMAAGLAVYSMVSGANILQRLHPAVMGGFLFGLVAPFIPPPTLGSPYVFVSSLVGLSGATSTYASVTQSGKNWREKGVFWFSNLVAAMTTGFLGYSLVYILLLH